MIGALALLCAPWATAQEAEGELTVYVFGEGLAPAADVEVQVGDRSGRTDTDGYLVLELPAGTYPVGVGGRATDVRIVSGRTSEVRLTVYDDGMQRADVEEPPAAAAPETTVDPESSTLAFEGRIVDDEGKPLRGARVFARGADADATSDEDGRFTLQLPAGPRDLSVMLTGYSTATVQVDVHPEASVDIPLSPSGGQLAAFVVKAPAVEGSTSLLLEERKASTSVSDAIGAEEMSRVGASDAAGALIRVTGLTVVGGRFVYVRGLGERYSSTTLNGALLPSPDPERRVVPLDLFPASLLHSVVIQKSFSPDMPAEFGGGTVQLRTREIPEDFLFNVKFSGSYLANTTFEEGLTYATGPTDWLGLDGGYRDLPPKVAAASDDSPLEESDLFSDRGYTASELEAFGESMPNRWNLGTRRLGPNHGMSLQIGNGHDLGDKMRIGWLGAATYSHAWDHDVYGKRYFAVGEGGALEVAHNYDFTTTTRDVGFGAIGNLGWSYGEHQHVQLTSLLNRKSSDEARIYEGPNRDVGEDIRVSRLRWIERQLTFHQLTGSHLISWPTLDWRASLSRASRNEPDRREYRYDQDGASGDWFLSDRPEGNQRFFSDLGDRGWDVGVDLTIPLAEAKDDLDVPARIKIGGVRNHKERGVDTRRFKFMHKGEQSRGDILANDPESIFTPDIIGPDGFQFEEITRQTDNYSASADITAGYGLVEVPWTPWLRTMVGARLEIGAQRVETFELFNPDQVPVVAELSTSDMLPAATVTLTLPADMMVRAGYGRTLSRPDFREMSPATFNDVTGGRQTFGNPDLDRALIDNVDLRWELFPAAGEVISIGGFAKRFKNPIEQIVVVSAQQSISFDNADSATNLGVEFEWRKSLDIVWDALANLWVAGNVAAIRSRVDLGENAGIQTSNVRALQGQSPYVVNLQLAWDDPDSQTSVTLLYNTFGKRIVDAGALGAPDSYELGYPQLDLVASQGTSAGFRVGAKIQNILDPVKVQTQGNRWSQRLRDGWSAGLSLAWSPPGPE